jgi:hypothetical protein
LPEDHQLERRREFEEILAHEAGRDLVPTGQSLDARFGPPPAFLGFDRRDEAGAAQSCQLRRMSLRCEIVKVSMGAVQ